MVGVLYHTGRVLPWRERKAITLFKVVESPLVGKLAHGVIFAETGYGNRKSARECPDWFYGGQLLTHGQIWDDPRRSEFAPTIGQ